MNLDDLIHYTPFLLSLFVQLGIVLSYLAWVLINNLKGSHLLVAVVMGLGISSAYFVKDELDLVSVTGLSIDVSAMTLLFISLSTLTIALILRNNEIIKQLRENEERSIFALEGACDAVWEWNPQTDQISFPLLWKEIIRYAENECPTTVAAWVETFHPDDKQSFLSTLHDYLATKERSFATEFRKWSTDNSLEWILARGKLVNYDEQGRPIRVIGTLTNISATKNLQAQLSQAQKLEAIGQLAAGVSHEINTPIQYIGDNLSALHENFAEISGFQQAMYEVLDKAGAEKMKALASQYDMEFLLEDSPLAIQQAIEGVERVTEIVKAIKTFSYVEQSHKKQFINLHEAINNALIITRNSYKYIAEVETDYSAEINSIECYASELNQVFINLIINAVHAIEEKKSGTGKIKVITRNLGTSVEILFQDNGAGMPSDIQDKVFNLFFTTKEVGKGTGQGLSLSHNIIVKKHGGQLFFESCPDHGTTFHIQLPL